MRLTGLRLRSVALLLLALSLLVLGPAVARADDDDGVVLSTKLRGSTEVPGPGDPDGRGSARITIDLGENRLCYRLKVKRIDPAVAAHIHLGPAGVAGPVVVGLAPPNPRSRDCTQSVAPALLADIASNPANYYVNVHSAPYLGGAVRGQLRRSGDD